MNYYFVLYKPYQVLCQFSQKDAGNKKVLKDLGHNLPEDVYPVGRLDYDSEGLLLLTNDSTLNARLLQPSNGHQRQYYVQVEGEATALAIEQLQVGVSITVAGKSYRTLPALACSRLDAEPHLPLREPPIRVRKHIPTSWLQLALCEGKNRQVRKMTAAVGLPTLRLVRRSIECITIDGYASGELRSYTKKQLYKGLGWGSE